MERESKAVNQVTHARRWKGTVEVSGPGKCPFTSVISAQCSPCSPIMDMIYIGLGEAIAGLSKLVLCAGIVERRHRKPKVVCRDLRKRGSACYHSHTGRRKGHPGQVDFSIFWSSGARR